MRWRLAGPLSEGKRSGQPDGGDPRARSTSRFSIGSLSRPALFDDVIRICLAKNPDDRWQTAADLLHQLKLLVRYGTLPVATSKGSRKREIVAWGAAALLLIALGSTLIPRFSFAARRNPNRVVFESKNKRCQRGL
jgi:serine/threonine protein kinase